LLPIVHGSLSKFNVPQTNWWSPLLSPFNYQLNPLSRLLFNWTFSFNYCSSTLTFFLIYCLVVALLLTFFQLTLNSYPSLNNYYLSLYRSNCIVYSSIIGRKQPWCLAPLWLLMSPCMHPYLLLSPCCAA
jgi:hypothetical protein